MQSPRRNKSHEKRNCALATGPFLRKSQNTVSIHPMILTPLLYQYCFNTEKYCFSLQGLAILQLSQARSALKIAKPPFTTEARVVRQAFSSGVPSAAVCVWRRKCVVGKLPCNALAFVWRFAQTDCQALACHPPVSIRLDGPWRFRCRRCKDKRTQLMSVLDFAIWDDVQVVF